VKFSLPFNPFSPPPSLPPTLSSICVWLLFRPLQLLYKLNPGWYIQWFSPVFIKYELFGATRTRFTDNIYSYILNDVISSTAHHDVKVGTPVTREGCVKLEYKVRIFSAKKLCFIQFCELHSGIIHSLHTRTLLRH